MHLCACKFAVFHAAISNYMHIYKYMQTYHFVAYLQDIIYIYIYIYVYLYACRNIVSTVNLGVRLDLKNIALHARNAEYNPKRFAAVIMRIREPKTTSLIFASGKMVCTGTHIYIYVCMCTCMHSCCT